MNSPAEMPLKLPKREVLRYLVVGIWNTVFGYGCFALFTYLLRRRFPNYGYVIGNVLAAVFSITVTFLGYKWLVFKTRGNYVREWWRSLIVYGTSTIIGTLMLPILVFLLRQFSDARESATYIAGAVVMAVSAIYGFFGNKHYTFRKRV